MSCTRILFNIIPFILKRDPEKEHDLRIWPSTLGNKQVIFHLKGIDIPVVHLSVPIW